MSLAGTAGAVFVEQRLLDAARALDDVAAIALYRRAGDDRCALWARRVDGYAIERTAVIEFARAFDSRGRELWALDLGAQAFVRAERIVLPSWEITDL